MADREAQHLNRPAETVGDGQDRRRRHHPFKEVVVVDRLPKTRSGKILRGTMRSIADQQPFNIPSTIDDPAIIDEIQHALVVRERPRPRATT